MAVRYEWDVEETAAADTDDHEEGECFDHRFCESYKEVLAVAATTPPEGTAWRPVLVRDDDAGRSWAYMENGKLPSHFEDAYGTPVAKVPKRFVDEVARCA